MGRSSIRQIKREILLDRIFFQSTPSITERNNSLFLGKRQLISEDKLRIQIKILSKEKTTENSTKKSRITIAIPSLMGKSEKIKKGKKLIEELKRLDKQLNQLRQELRNFQEKAAQKR